MPTAVTSAPGIALIKRLVAEDPDLLWTNQYGNPANPRIHSVRTAASTMARIGPIDYLFVGAGTTGTLMGCAEYFRRFSPRTRIIAVDTEGSVTFGGPSRTRYIPGLGTSPAPGTPPAAAGRRGRPGRRAGRGPGLPGHGPPPRHPRRRLDRLGAGRGDRAGRRHSHGVTDRGALARPR
ncbi:hypothetical protein Shyd_68370 [Streptomyces hydrogenans]|uniref:Tryptophan synthase beta chain-like PALP domain-containing protein n=1 Tax=Streptomyces hydrogenans TaxID=1873719 RepID=A0ABQ3PKB5_9ACTN|nr:hypothetical protein Shyd_68370 [Streptomyces hydrogenans]